ncbi:MAG: aldo/keto reductase [Planctomycetaceae bacterium]|nr:aldo/keto reductase [Planctomycetaceae bacterium]
MERRRLGTSSVTVTDICMGTMTFGTQCDEKLSFEIMDRAYEAGIDFFDAAELYPVPPSAEKFGLTEEIVGRWMKTKPRETIILATKVTGPAHGWFVPPVRHGKTALDRVQIMKAVEDSLRRLQTDYIDLYQTHWPDHGARYEDLLEVLTELIKQGKVRVAGCSNETCWGVMKSLSAAENNGLCRYDTIQNNFSLINRRCESELAQVCRQEKISLLPFSPLGGGVLTGKYSQQYPPGARFTEYRNAGERQQKMAERFLNDRTRQTVAELSVIADELNVTLTALAVAWSKQHDFVASTIIGATTIQQLNESLQADGLILDSETLRRIDEIDERIPNPMKEDGLRRL